jgi:hypothetical protein
MDNDQTPNRTAADAQTSDESNRSARTALVELQGSSEQSERTTEDRPSVTPGDLVAPLRTALERSGFQPDPAIEQATRPQTVVKLVTRSITAAGITDQPVTLAFLTEEQREIRRQQIARIVVDVEESKCLELSDRHLQAVTRYLYNSPFTLRQIRRAGEIIKETTTYRSIASDIWAEAFAESRLTAREVQRLRSDAFEQGRLAERAENPPRQLPESIAGIAQAIRQIDDLRSQNLRLRNRIKELERRIAS